MRKLVRFVVAVTAVGLAGYGAYQWWLTRNLGAVQRGWSVADRKGCFTCHGPGGLRGMPNPGYGLGDVPPWAGGLVTMYAENEQELREWILDGIPQRLKGDPEQMKLREGMVVEMPAWRGQISEQQIDQIWAYIRSRSN